MAAKLFPLEKPDLEQYEDPSFLRKKIEESWPDLASKEEQPPTSGFVRQDALNELLAWKSDHPGAEFFSVREFQFDVGGKSQILTPDIAYYPEDLYQALPDSEKGRLNRFVPSMIVEVLSETDSQIERIEKAKNFLKAGAQEALILDVLGDAMWHLTDAGKEPVQTNLKDFVFTLPALQTLTLHPTKYRSHLEELGIKKKESSSDKDANPSEPSVVTKGSLKKNLKKSETKPPIDKDISEADLDSFYYLQDLVDFCKENHLECTGLRKKQLIKNICAHFETPAKKRTELQEEGPAKKKAKTTQKDRKSVV